MCSASVIIQVWIVRPLHGDWQGGCERSRRCCCDRLVMAAPAALRCKCKFSDEKAMNSVKVLITGIVSIVIQFGLAIAGWGGWRAFFAHPALRALAWVTVGLAALAVPSGGGISTGEKEDEATAGCWLPLA
jgi:hypothetical protein